MKKALVLAVALVFSGCTKLYNSNEVSLSETNKILSYETGIVTSVRNVVIKDDGSGAVTGALAGSVIGSLFGNGKGNILSTLLGTLSGAYVGYESDKANAQELFIKLDDGRNVVAIVKGVKIAPGDKVRLILDGGRIVRVEKI